MRTRNIPTHTRLNPPRRGFSLFELAVVLAVLAIAAAIVSPRYASALARYRADASAERVAQDLRAVGHAAHAAGAPLTLTFDAARSAYACPGVCAIDLDNAPYHARISGPDFAGLPTLEFDGYGTPASAGSVTVVVGSEARLIAVAADGTVTVSTLAAPPVPTEPVGQPVIIN